MSQQAADARQTDLVVLVETMAEARSLAEELKVRQERLTELLAPSEAALQARTEYLDRMMNEHLSRAGTRITKTADEVQSIARRLSDEMARLPATIAEMDARREQRARQ